MRNTLETRVGIFFALCLIVAVIILEMVGVAEYFKPGYHVFADFRSVQDLKKGDLVKVAGVEVGRVDDIRLTNNVVRVAMKIKEQKAEINTTSRATIRFTGLMGQNYVAVDFGTNSLAPKALEGTVLETVEQPDLSGLMAKLEQAAGSVESLKQSFSSDNLSPLFGPITEFMKNNNTNLSVFISNASFVSSQVAQGKGSVGKLINDDALYSQALTAVAGIQAGATELKTIATDVRGLLADVNAGKGNLGLLVRDDALYRESTNAMTNIREIMQKMNRGDGTVGKLINDDSFYKNAKVSLQKLDKATEELEDQGPLSVLGMAINKIF